MSVNGCEWRCRSMFKRREAKSGSQPEATRWLRWPKAGNENTTGDRRRRRRMGGIVVVVAEKKSNRSGNGSSSWRRIEYDAICRRAERTGLRLQRFVIGPLFRFTVTIDNMQSRKDTKENNASDLTSFNKERVGIKENTIGYCSGYILPTFEKKNVMIDAHAGSFFQNISAFSLAKVVHLDSIEVRNGSFSQNPDPTYPSSSSSPHQNNHKKSIFGTSLTLGTAALVHAQQLGCTKARLLAIYDDPYTHSRLVKVQPC